jgi:hypothetical protein
MCQISRKTEKIQVATQAIEVYKILNPAFDKRHDRDNGRGFSQHQSFEYKQFVTHKKNASKRQFYDAVSYKRSIAKMVTFILGRQGFHSFKNKRSVFGCEDFGQRGAIFEIPKGAKYIAGRDNDGSETYVSNKIVLKDFID